MKLNFYKLCYLEIIHIHSLFMQKNSIKSNFTKFDEEIVGIFNLQRFYNISNICYKFIILILL